MRSLIELFDICNNRRDYTTVTRADGKKTYEVDYKFEEDAAERTLYIYFEPSDGNVDWRVNFAYWRKPYKDMVVGYRVHGGFLESWKLIDDAIGAKIRELDEECEITEDGCWNWKWQKVVIVGYSHGGALAALCHEFVWYNRVDLRDGALVGISFDGPRIFAGLWVPAALRERWAHFHVIRNQDDLITHLPPVIFFFRHVGNLVKVGAKARSKAQVFKEWMATKFKDSMLMQELFGIKAHYPEEIKKGIAELEDGRIGGLDTHVVKIEWIEEDEKRD
jgi:hypothetical protein